MEMKSRPLLVLIAFFTLAVGLALAQQLPKDPPASGESPVMNDGLISMDVLVTDKSGTPVNRLRRSDFKVFDDDVEQTVTAFSKTDVVPTILILTEFTGSRSYTRGTVVRSVAGFINSLLPDDRAAFAAYDTESVFLTDFTTDRDALFDGLDTLQAPTTDDTALLDATWDALDTLHDLVGKKVIFLFSTGLDTVSKHSLADLLQKAGTSHTMIYPFSLDMRQRSDGETPGDKTLQTLADTTGGTAFFPKSDDDMKDIFTTFSLQLRNQYTLGWIPEKANAPGSVHTVRIQVSTGKPDPVVVKHKKTYITP
jgi:Ca-activated chloride channel family protein